MSPTQWPLSILAGQLIVGGFAGSVLTTSMSDALARGERAGVVLFKRNLAGAFEDVAALNRSVAAASARLHELPVLIAIDQEGGRVARLGSPLLQLPPMRALGRYGDERLVERSGRLLGSQLASLGFTTDFAPVLDVDTCPTNPIIGDRSFSSDPTVVRRFGMAFARGLQTGGVMACAKHFPGHGDTTQDSHLDLPIVSAPRSRLDAFELAPFRGLRASTCGAMMTAHVVYDALDPGVPATLSPRIVRGIARDELGYDGLIVSDDLEMRALADRMSIEEAAVRAVRAGCDVLLVCASEELQARAHEALVLEAERDPAFRARVDDAAQRSMRTRMLHRPRLDGPRGLFDGDEARSLRLELDALAASVS